MLVESLVYALSWPTTPAGFRRHLFEAVGLWSRGTRRAEAWSHHVGETRGVIDRGIDAITPRRMVMVLGSGPLFDIPVEALARAFARVVLLDQAHLSTIRHRLRHRGNIERHWHDLSSATSPNPLAFLDSVPQLDWVLSVNLLSQLARAAAEGTERAVIDHHLDALAALPCPVTLITDTAYRVLDRAGTLREDFDLLYGRQMPAPQRSWEWTVAPFGEESPDTSRVHRVAAWDDWRRAARS